MVIELDSDINLAPAADEVSDDGVVSDVEMGGDVGNLAQPTDNFSPAAAKPRQGSGRQQNSQRFQDAAKRPKSSLKIARPPRCPPKPPAAVDAELRQEVQLRGLHGNQPAASIVMLDTT